jgi:hypothetical protein
MRECRFNKTDIIREKFTLNYYLVVDTNLSDRTGNVVGFRIMDLNTTEVRYLSWKYFDYYEFVK